MKNIRYIAVLLMVALLFSSFVSCDSAVDSGLNSDAGIYAPGASSDIPGNTEETNADNQAETKENGDKDVSDNDDAVKNDEVNNDEVNNDIDNNDTENDDVETDDPNSEDGGGDDVFRVTAEIVNKNGAKGVLTLTSDDGDQRTSDFFYTKVVPEYDFFKVTIALPTSKVGGIAVTSDGKGYVMNENGRYSLTGYLSNTYSSSIRGSVFTSGRYSTMRDFWKKITDNGAIELASHSHTHGPWPATDDIVYEGSNILWPKGSAIKEIRASAQILRNGLEQETPFIMRPGGSFMTTEVSTYFKNLVWNDGTYIGMRGSNGAPPLPGAANTSTAKLNTVKKFTTQNGRLTIATILVRAYEAGFNASGSGFATTSSSSKADVKSAGISAWKQYVDYAIEFGQWASLGFHSVVADSDTATGYEVYDWQVIALMEYVKPLVQSGELWLGSFSDVAKYYFEWSSAEVSAEYKDEQYIEVKLTDKEEDERFDEPLTVKISVPSDWQEANLTTDGVTTSLDIHTEDDGSRFVYANILPGDGTSVIRP